MWLVASIQDSVALKPIKDVWKGETEKLRTK